jgi:hypothetical protein
MHEAVAMSRGDQRWVGRRIPAVRRRVPPTVFVVVFATTVAGCSMTNPGSTTSSGPGGRLVLLRSLTAAELALLHRAEEILTRDCMARHGFRVWVETGERPPEIPQFPFVVDDVRWARSHGYGTDIQQQVNKAKSADPNARYFASLPADRKAAAVVALNGERPEGLEVRLPDGRLVHRSDRGCTSEAMQKLYSDLPGWFRASRTVNVLPSIAYGRMVRDPLLKRDLSRWARCMQAMGLAYPSPEALRAALGQRAPRDREIRFAVAEATCANRTPLARTARQLNQRYMEQLEAEYRSEVAMLRRLQLDALPRARAITDGDQP